MKEKSTTIVPMSEQFCTDSFLPASWFIFGDWLGPYLASWLPWLQTLASVSFRCPARTGEAGRPHSVSNQPVSFEFDSPPASTMRHLSSSAWKPLRMIFIRLLILPPCSTIHPLSLEQEWPLQNCQIWRADILHCGPTSYGLQSIQSIQPGNSSAAERYNPSNNTSGKVQQFVQSILYQHLHICIHSLNVKDGTLYPAPNLLTFSITYYFACIHLLNCISCT